MQLAASSALVTGASSSGNEPNVAVTYNFNRGSGNHACWQIKALKHNPQIPKCVKMYWVYGKLSTLLIIHTRTYEDPRIVVKWEYQTWSSSKANYLKSVSS